MRNPLIYVLLGACLLLFFALARAEDRIERIERQLCAFRFYEDGSAAPRRDDTDRFRCMGLKITYGFKQPSVPETATRKG